MFKTVTFYYIIEYGFDGRNKSLIIFLYFRLLTSWKEVITGKTTGSISLDYSRVEIVVAACPYDN